ncbi:MAG: hypothetical protein HYT12_04730 [Candidatus Liptonbacteria bacterium]|nr:hypothetical protein [Candidatus Liptonbacteria bacterium]
MYYSINCKDLTGEECNFVAGGGTPEEVKDIFYSHHAESSIHEEKYYSATDEERERLEKKLEEYLEKQE